MSKITTYLFATLLLSALFAAGLQAQTTITAASCNASDVQTAINSASSGSKVVVPGGTCTWSTAVNIPNTQGITLDGGGNTTIVDADINVASDVSTPTEIKGFTFTGTYSSSANPAISTNGCGGLPSCGRTVTALFRIDNNSFSDPSETAIFIATSGNGTGLIDHNTFTGGGASEMIHNLGMGASDASGWTDSVTPGAPNMLYIETNTFTYNATGNPAYFWGSSAVQSYYGARTVFRYNTLNNVQVDQHGTCGMIGARWWEIYENTFNVAANGNQSNYMALRDGSGVVFNNHVSDPQNNSGGGSIELTEDCTSGTYPLAYQVGRGINQKSSPAYVWGNDSSMSVDSGNSSYVNEGTDYFVSASEPSSMLRDEMTSDTTTTTYKYTPLAYPYPVDPATPNPPLDLSAVPH